MPNVEAPIEIARPFGRFGKIPADDVDYCDGPSAVGATPTTFRRYDYRWVFWSAADGVRMQRFDLFTGDETAGALTGLFDGVVLPWVSACFDGGADPVVATELGGTITLRKFEVGIPTDYVFVGKSPVVFYTGQLYFQPTDKEVVVFYLNAAGTELRVRRQLTGFAVESVVGPLPSPLARTSQKTTRQPTTIFVPSGTYSISDSCVQASCPRSALATNIAKSSEQCAHEAPLINANA
jgi:hypothetical protein